VTSIQPRPTGTAADREQWAQQVLTLVREQEKFERRQNRWWRRLAARIHK
jgi:hypothetical protein